MCLMLKYHYEEKTLELPHGSENTYIIKEADTSWVTIDVDMTGRVVVEVVSISTG